MPTWLAWLLLPLLLFVAVWGGVVAIAALAAAVLPRATWPQTYHSATKAGMCGATAVMAVLVLVRIWP